MPKTVLLIRMATPKTKTATQDVVTKVTLQLGKAIEADMGGMSQAAYARRLGLSHTAIFRLINGRAFGSLALWSMAKEKLGEDSAPVLFGQLQALTREEEELLSIFRMLDPRDRHASTEMMRALYQSDPPSEYGEELPRVKVKRA